MLKGDKTRKNQPYSQCMSMPSLWTSSSQLPLLHFHPSKLRKGPANSCAIYFCMYFLSSIPQQIGPKQPLLRGLFCALARDGSLRLLATQRSGSGSSRRISPRGRRPPRGGGSRSSGPGPSGPSPPEADGGRPGQTVVVPGGRVREARAKSAGHRKNGPHRDQRSGLPKWEEISWCKGKNEWLARKTHLPFLLLVEEVVHL